MSPVRAAAFVSRGFAAALSPCLLLPGGLPPAFPGTGALPKDVTLDPSPERPLAVQDRNLCELLPSRGDPWGGQDAHCSCEQGGVSLEAWLSP